MYEIIVAGRIERTLRVALDDLVDDWQDGAGGTIALRTADQSGLVALINRLHELGIPVEQVRPCPEDHPGRAEREGHRPP